MSRFKYRDIWDSKREAFEKVKKFLDAEDVDAQFSDRTGAYYSSDKFIITWKGNYKEMAAEYGIDKTDAFYASYSGFKAIKVCRNLFYEKQLKGFPSIERALIEVGLTFCITAEEKEEFFNKYAVRYNEKIKNLKPTK
jgi:hypothetical protein